MTVFQKDISFGVISPPQPTGRECSSRVFWKPLGIRGLRHELVRLEGETEDSSLGAHPGLKHEDVEVVCIPRNQRVPHVFGRFDP